MRLGVHQPNFAPWCGYFAKMRQCDVFVFLDDAQMPGGQSYVYRTKIMGKNPQRWLSIPTKFHLGDSIMTVRFADAFWPVRHLDSIRSAYGRAPHFEEVYHLLEPIYESPGEYLSLFNQRIIMTIADYLGINCRFVNSCELKEEGKGDDRLIHIAQKLGASTYISGKGGGNYQDPQKFAKAGIELQMRIYDPVPYPQNQPGFTPGLSIIDAICYLGKGTADLLSYPA